MGKRAKVRVLSDTENEIMAEHDGFKKMYTSTEIHY